MSFVDGIVTLISPTLRHEYAHTLQLELQHKQNMLDLELREREAQVSAAQNAAMVGNTERISQAIDQSRANFCASVRDLERTLGVRVGRDEFEFEFEDE